MSYIDAKGLVVQKRMEAEGVAPYRHVEVEHVVECEACAMHRKGAEEVERRNQRQKAKALVLGRKVFIFGPWMFELARLAHYLPAAYPDGPAWAVLTTVAAMFGILVLGVWFGMSTASAFDEINDNDD